MEAMLLPNDTFICLFCYYNAISMQNGGKMNINLHLTGELEDFVNELVERGLAANKTEAVRLALTRYYETRQKARGVQREPLEQSTIETHWNNPSDEKAEKFYRKRYL
ncbi:hypothetical protein GF412_02875 [Candidatus Micrarchaeota archaeon]|nr:hypothetical protein [Candidatus Micrarchaeota archaeon]MBD3417897.1 hypothetical protein [Candidatus Micrarchaeota archaeon]